MCRKRTKLKKDAVVCPFLEIVFFSFPYNGPLGLSISHQRAVHKRKISWIVLSTNTYFDLHCEVLALFTFYTLPSGGKLKGAVVHFMQPSINTPHMDYSLGIILTLSLFYRFYLNLTTPHFFFKKGQTRPLFVYFCSFHMTNIAQIL